MRAEVGVLSRNIRIIGKSYSNIEDEAFGARVLASFHTEVIAGEVVSIKGVFISCFAICYSFF